MHDDDTSKAPSANRMPWEAGYEAPQEPPSHEAPQPGPAQQQAWGQPQQTWQNSQAQGWQGPVAMDPTTSTRVDTPRRGIGAWVLPIMLVLAGVAAFAIVTFFMTGKSNDGPTSVSPPASGQAIPSTSQSPSSSSSTSEAHDDFPADSDTSCTEGNDTVGNSAQDAVRRVRGSGTSCVFLQSVRAKVLEHVSGDQKATNFQITAHSQATDRDYVMSCQRTNHLSYCSGGNNAALYVKDTIS